MPLIHQISHLVSSNQQRKYVSLLDDIPNQSNVMMIEFDRFSFFPSDVYISHISNLDFALISIDLRNILYISSSNYVRLSERSNGE